MSARLYETLYMLDSTKVAADADAARATIHGVLERYGAEIVISRPWDENRKLAYPINKQKKAYFLIVYYRIESTKQAELERDFKLVEILLRHLTSAIDPKWEETMLDIARNDNQTGFAHRGMHDDTAPTDVTPNLNGMDGSDDGPPPPRGRGRRDMAEKPE